MRQTVMITALCAMLTVPVWAQTPITETIDSFETLPWDNNPIGSQPPGYSFFGYGPPAWSTQETGITTDGDRAWRINLPVDTAYGVDPDGTIAIYTQNVAIDDLASYGINWDYPVTISVDVYCHDTTTGGYWNTWMDTQGIPNRTVNQIQWGDDGVGNQEWLVASVEIAAGQAGAVASNFIVAALDFSVDADDTGTSAAIFDNLSITYVPMPTNEVCNNGLDDDQDGQTDCDDSDCVGDPSCPCNPVIVFDSDNDQDVDQDDFGFFATCITGPGPNNPLFDTLSDECKCMDVNGSGGTPDNAIDQQDLSRFEACASGPAVPAAEACDD
jgi:hypothetical protein